MIYVRLQAKSRHDPHSEGMLSTAQKIVAKNGLLGLYRGLDTKLAQSMVAAGFMFMSYENIFEMVNKIMTAKNLQKLK